MSAKTIPAGHHTVTPYLAIKNAVETLEFYKRRSARPRATARAGDVRSVSAERFHPQASQSDDEASVRRCWWWCCQQIELSGFVTHELSAF